MNSIQIIPQDAIQLVNNQAKTDSLKVATAFGKRHSHVVEKMKSLDCSDQFLTSNFSAVKFNHKGNEYDAYEMTKDGFMFLVMGFTGKKAAQVKEAYINAFNAMAEQLAKQEQPQPPQTLTPAMQNHIQNRVVELAKQKGNSFQAVYKSIKNKFHVGTYKDIPADQYPALCAYLGTKPLEGELLEPETRQSIDVRKVILENIAAPSLPVDAEITQAIDRQAVKVAIECYEVVKDFIGRYVEYNCARGNPSSINKTEALQVIGEVDLDLALTNKYYTRLGRLKKMADALVLMSKGYCEETTEALLH